jgi:hypothetical protein
MELRKRETLLACLALGVLYAGILTAFLPVASPNPYFYDEADYMHAGRLGFWSNYLDKPSVSGIEFVRMGLELIRDRNKRSSISEQMRATDDVTFYRHYHGPLYAYWLSFGQAIGLATETAFRGSGLIPHLITATILLFGMRKVFPGAGWAGALCAAGVYAGNRTGLITGLTITQHAMFPIVAAGVLFSLSRFCVTLDRRYWYATMALLGVSLAAVELTFVLAGAMGVVLLALGKRLRALYSWKELLKLSLRGVGAFAAGLFVVWPMGLLTLNASKGFLVMGYFAVVRRNFSPGGPLDMWKLRLEVAPLELLAPALALVGIALWWRRYGYRWELAPFVSYVAVFSAVTLVMTLPYMHYHGSLMMAASVVTGAALGELWRHRRMWGAAAAALTAMTALITAVEYREQLASDLAVKPVQSDVLSFLRKKGIVDGTDGDAVRLIAPFLLVPTIHYYYPRFRMASYDPSWAVERLIAEATAPQGPGQLLCAPPICDALRQHARVVEQEAIREGGLPEDDLYWVRLDKTAAGAVRN